MFIYNITVKVDWSIHDGWLIWMVEQEIPRMLQTAYFSRHQMMRLLDIDDTDGPTYAIQYFMANLDDYRGYIARLSATDNANTYARWLDRCVMFATIMEVVN